MSLHRFLPQLAAIVTYKESLIQHLHTPLYTNAYYLMANSVIGAILGFSFWVVVARLYPPEVVGLASALVSAMFLLTLLAELGLGFSMIRFLPTFAEDSTKMLNSCFTIGSLATIVAAGVFLAGLSFWSPALIFLQHNPLYIASFVLFCVAWNLSHWLDFSFIAKRLAKFMFIKNLIINVPKILFPVVLVGLVGAFGIFSIIGATALVGAVIAMIWLLPRVQPGYKPLPTILGTVIRSMTRYSLGNYLSLLFWLAPTYLFPLMVINILGAELNAYFYTGWTVAMVLSMLVTAISLSLFSEGSYQEELLPFNTRRALKLALFILIPGLILVFILGNTILSIFGEAYAENATTLLWILASSTIPRLITELYLSIRRVRKDLLRLIVIPAIATSLSLGLGYFFMVEIGLNGIGLGWLIGQSAVATGIILFYLSKRRRSA